MLDVILTILVLMIVAPFCLLFHELGHLYAAKMVKANVIELSIGVGKTFIKIKRKGIHITVRHFFFLNSYTSSYRQVPYLSYEKILISMMGPLFSLFLAMIWFIIYSFFGMILIFYVFHLFNLWIGIINLLPFKIGQKESDGYTICKQLAMRKNDSRIMK